MAREQKDSTEMMMEATLNGFYQVKTVIDEIKQSQKNQVQATYQGLTGSGKARFVSSLVKSEGSQVKVAETLGLTRGRISQLVRADNNKKNGK